MELVIWRTGENMTLLLSHCFSSTIQHSSVDFTIPRCLSICIKLISKLYWQKQAALFQGLFFETTVVSSLLRHLIRNRSCRTPRGLMWKLWREITLSARINLKTSGFLVLLFFFFNALSPYCLTSFLASHCPCHGILWRTDYGQFSAGLSEMHTKERIRVTFLQVPHLVSFYFDSPNAPKLGLIFWQVYNNSDIVSTG